MRERTSCVEFLRRVRSGSAVPHPGVVFGIVRHLVESSAPQRIDGAGRVLVRKRGIQPLRPCPVVFGTGLQNGQDFTQPHHHPPTVDLADKVARDSVFVSSARRRSVLPSAEMSGVAPGVPSGDPIADAL